MTEVPRPALEPELEAIGFAVPLGRHLALPGRGTTFIREWPGPEGAPTLMLLHGLGATGALNWYAAFQPLAQHFRVIAIDHRGHGRGMRSPVRFRLADCADDVAAVARELGVRRFIAVGYSMGGPIAQLTWLRHPNVVEGLVLCATSRDFRGQVRERLQFAALGVVATMTALPWRGPFSRPLLQLAANVLTPEFDEPGLRQWVLSELHRHDPRKVLQAAESLGRFTSHDWIGEVDVPTAVVVTTSDQLVPVHRQIKLARQIPSAVLHPVEGDHLVSAKAPGTFVAGLVEACELVVRRAGRWSAERRRATGPTPGGGDLPAGIPAG